MNDILNLYYKKERKKIEEEIDKEVEKKTTNNYFINEFNKIMDDMNEQFKELYDKQPDDNCPIIKVDYEDQTDYFIDSNFESDLYQDLYEKRQPDFQKLDELVKEVQAHINVIDKSNASDKYQLTMQVLKDYHIVD